MIAFTKIAIIKTILKLNLKLKTVLKLLLGCYLQTNQVEKRIMFSVLTKDKNSGYLHFPFSNK